MENFENTMPEEALSEPIPAEPETDSASEYRMVFEITPETPPEPEQPVRKKNRVGTKVLVALLILALIAQAIVIGVGFASVKNIESSAINGNGELVIYYSDGTSQNLGVVVGKDGQDGEDGKSGTNGTTTIIGAEDSTTLSVSQALRSSVSILCTFVAESRQGGTTTYYSAGSGVIYDLDMETGSAFVITNYHVVYDEDSRQDNGIAETINLYLYGGEYSGLELQATYVGGSMYYDLAILRVENSDILKNSDALAVTVVNSDDVQVGSTAIAVGNAASEGISVTSGIVSVDSEYLSMTAVDGITTVDYRVMRIDTAVNSGNSGGGLFDRNGNLIGIVNAKIIDDGVENIGYALPSTVVTAVADNIIYYCYESDNENVMRAIMGITVITNDSCAVYEEETGLMKIRETVVVHSVDETQLGKVFQVDDQLVSITIGGKTLQITRQHQLIDAMLTARVGDEVTFTVLRNGQETALSITVTEDCLTAY